MTAKEFLRRYIQADREINAKLEEVSRLRQLATKTTKAFDDDRIVNGTKRNHIAEIVDKIVDMEREVDRDIDRLQQIKKEVEQAINSVDDSTLRTLLRYRYICGYKWERIAVEMNYSWRATHYLHGRALSKIKIVA